MSLIPALCHAWQEGHPKSPYSMIVTAAASGPREGSSFSRSGLTANACGLGHRRYPAARSRTSPITPAWINLWRFCFSRRCSWWICFFSIDLFLSLADFLAILVLSTPKIFRFFTAPVDLQSRTFITCAPRSLPLCFIKLIPKEETHAAQSLPSPGTPPG